MSVVKSTVSKIDLCGEWIVSDETGTSHVGKVPGCIHTDLFSEDEMYFEMNSRECRFIEERDWKYEKHFAAYDLGEHPVLVFEGLDTYCEIYLNGQKVGNADNMFIPHKFSVEGLLKQGENVLEVCFQSPIKAVEGKEKRTGAFTTERLHTRRMQCTYGWDWVDRFVTCGIYRAAYITFEEDMDLENVYVFTNNIDSYSAQVKVTEHFKRFEQGGLVKTEIVDPAGAVIACQEHYCEEEQSILYFDIEEPKLWYPRPYGEQPLYTLKITVGEHVHYQKFGIRTVKILQLKDREAHIIEKCRVLQQTDSGREYDMNEEYFGFILIINGVKIFCTGANWVPCEPFPSAETEEKITRILEMAADAGINMLRIWGGGLFEQQHLYNECDRLGILVTQDFLMACGRYPEKDEYFQEQLRREAKFAALYLRNHPSLVWWTGDNENAINGYDVLEEFNGRISARKVIAPVLEQLDYNRAFLFSSPYGGKKYASKTVGTTHNTQFLGNVFDYLKKNDISDYREYWKEYTARFIAEEPAMGAVCKKSLEEFISEENLAHYDMWLYHTKTNPGLRRELLDIVTDFAKKLFGDFRDYEDACFKMRYIHYEWVRLTLGNARSNLWFNSGIVYWMLNDCWPAAVGWSLCDYYVRAKAGYYALKNYNQSANVYIEKLSDGYKLCVTTILNKKVECSVRVIVLNLKNNHIQELLQEKITLHSGKEERFMDVELSDEEMMISEVMSEGKMQRSWYKEGLPVLKETCGLQWRKHDDCIEVWTDSYVHAVEIEGVEGLEDNYFSLLPGERRILNCAVSDDIEISGVSFLQ